MGIFFDWAEISKSKKGVRTSDGKACGVIVSSAGGEIFVSYGKEYWDVIRQNKKIDKLNQRKQVKARD